MAAAAAIRSTSLATTERTTAADHTAAAERATIGDGEDVEEGVLDLGEKELDLGMSYVGVSRFKALAAMKIIHPMWGRFERIGARLPSDAKYKALQARSAEATRIDGIVASTKERHAETWQRCVDWAAEVSSLQQQQRQRHLALITEDAVHAALTRLFTRGNSDQCSIEELMAEMDIPLGFELQEAIVKELQMLEDKNCLMYRERVIHLI